MKAEKARENVENYELIGWGDLGTITMSSGISSTCCQAVARAGSPSSHIDRNGSMGSEMEWRPIHATIG